MILRLGLEGIRLDDDELADELRRIADLVAEGFREGQLLADASVGWWSLDRSGDS